MLLFHHKSLYDSGTGSSRLIWVACCLGRPQPADPTDEPKGAYQRLTMGREGSIPICENAVEAIRMDAAAKRTGNELLILWRESAASESSGKKGVRKKFLTRAS